MEWLSVTQLSNSLEIPETTTRRYLNSFEEYFRWEQVGRGKKYEPSSVEILQRIAMLYGTDRETIEIKKILANEYAFTIDDDETTIDPPAYDISGKLDEFKENQEEFNKQLLRLLQDQQEYINKLLDNQNQNNEQEKRLVSSEDKSKNYFNQVTSEHKVNKELKKEALSLWEEKPTEERLKKVGWFRKEEDRDKRDLFIKDYVDENFEESLKKEFDI